MEIEIIPLGNIDKDAIDHLVDQLPQYFGNAMESHKRLGVPTYSYDHLRGQYHSSAILENLSSRLRASKNRKILAVIDEDLFSPELTFVFGTADPSSGVAIISLKRLRQSSYGLSEDRDLFLSRVLKEAVHETGHLLGLFHCSRPECVMFFSNSITDTDNKQADFCKRCKSLL